MQKILAKGGFKSNPIRFKIQMQNLTFQVIHFLKGSHVRVKKIPVIPEGHT